MIQNINFPEGTQVSYTRGSVFDQFNKDIKIDISTSSANSLYGYSSLKSARKLDGPYSYAFYYSEAYFRPHILATRMYQYGVMYYDVILDKSEVYDAYYAFANLGGGKKHIKISGNFSNLGGFLYNISANSFRFVTLDVDTSNMSLSNFLYYTL